jgi:hypothetical protein
MFYVALSRLRSQASKAPTDAEPNAAFLMTFKSRLTSFLSVIGVCNGPHTVTLPLTYGPDGPFHQHNPTEVGLRKHLAGFEPVYTYIKLETPYPTR